MNPRMQRQLMILFLMSLGAIGFMVYQNRKTIQSLKESQRYYRQARQYSGRPVNVSAEIPVETLNDCPRFFDQLETLPIESLMFDLKAKRLGIPARCEQDPISNDLFVKFQQNCSPELLDRNQDVANENCESSLFQYRARRIQLWTQNRDLKELSTDLVIQRFFGLLAAGGMKAPAGADEVRAIALELESRMPQSAAPYRIEVASYLNDQNLTAEESQRYAAVLREARLRDPEDWQLFEVQLLKQSKEDPVGYEQAVQAFMASQPTLPISLYHGGCVAWNHGNRDQATELFRRASQGAPRDPRFNSTSQKAQTANLGTPICTAPLTFNLEDF
jgi:hypothetical protein